MACRWIVAVQWNAIIALGLLMLQIVGAAEPREIPYNKTDFVGPDGPWNKLSIIVGAPVQLVDFHPIVEPNRSVLMAQNACQDADTSCIGTAPNMFKTSPDMWSGSAWPDTDILNTSRVPGRDFNEPMSELLNLSGSALWYAESMTLDPYAPSKFWSGEMALLQSRDYRVNFPDGTSYVPISMLSLADGIITMPMKQNQSNIGWTFLANLLRPDNDRTVASASWGLHVGSVSQKIPGSLWMGGYDQNRVIGKPGVFQSDSMTLAGISLSNLPKGGANPFPQDSLQTNFLQPNQSTPASVQAVPDPSVPYMYLSKDTCDSLARILPVTFNENLNLYTWDRSAALFSDITTSFSTLDFNFTDAFNTLLIIKVPFALLNLTLDFPIARTPTAYFPCYPVQSSASYRLGRAFLQAAFLGANYEAPSATGRDNPGAFFLAQAPGPALPTALPVIKSINPTDTSILRYPYSPSWDETWSHALSALPSSATMDLPGISQAPSPLTRSDTNRTQIIVGVSVGGAVGALAVLSAISFWFIQRRRHRRLRQERENRLAFKARPPELGGDPKKMPPVEIDADNDARLELDGGSRGFF